MDKKLNVIEAAAELLNNYEKIKEFSRGIHIDQTDEMIKGVGIYMNGDTKVKEDVLGNQKRQINFYLYSVNKSTSDFERLQNSNFLLELGYYLDKQKDIKIIGKIGKKEYPGVIKKISCSNGMKYSVDTTNKNFIYQIQFLVDYKLNMEEEK